MQHFSGGLVKQLDCAVDTGHEDALTVTGEPSTGDGVANEIGHLILNNCEQTRKGSKLITIALRT